MIEKVIGEKVESDKIRVYVNKKLQCISSNVLKLYTVSTSYSPSDCTQLESLFKSTFESQSYAVSFEERYLNLKRPMADMQIMFPHEFKECKVVENKVMMNSTKNSFYKGS